MTTTTTTATTRAWARVTARAMGIGTGIAALLVACGGDDGPNAADARPPSIDAPQTADAPLVDAPGVDAPPSTGRFVVSAAQVPTSTTEAMTLGMDLDGDEPTGDPTVDNQLGSVIAAVGSMGFDTQGGVTFSIDHGQAITLVELRVDDTLHTFPGSDPQPPACSGPSDTVCRHHLDGTGSFDLPAGAPTGTMPTSRSGGVTTGGPGTAVIEIALLGNPMPLRVELIGARFEGTVAPGGITAARLAGAVTVEQVDRDVIPAITSSFQAVVARDCDGGSPPGCGCAPSSQGGQLLSLFDQAPQDCAIALAEVRESSLIQSLFAPDVTIGGVDALSLGVGVTAVPAAFRFTPP